MPGNGIMSVQASSFSLRKKQLNGCLQRFRNTSQYSRVWMIRCRRGLHRLVIANNRTGDFW